MVISLKNTDLDHLRLILAAAKGLTQNTTAWKRMIKIRFLFSRWELGNGCWVDNS